MKPILENESDTFTKSRQDGLVGVVRARPSNTGGERSVVYEAEIRGGSNRESSAGKKRSFRQLGGSSDRGGLHEPGSSLGGRGG